MIKAKDMQVFEILEEFDKTVGRSQKINYLREYRDHTPLTYVLKFNYCDTIKSLIPEGKPPFNDEPDDGPSKASLWQYLNVFPTFVQSNQAAQIKPLQREKVFIEMLEAIAVEEANMIILAKDRDLEKLYPTLDIGIVKEAFPNLEIQTKQEAKEPTEEEKKADILSVIQDKKEQVKSLQTEIKDLTKEAKAYSE